MSLNACELGYTEKLLFGCFFAAEREFVSHLPINCFGAVKAAVGTPFLFAFPMATLFSADKLFVFQSIGFQGAFRTFAEKELKFLFFSLVFCDFPLTILRTIPARMW